MYQRKRKAVKRFLLCFAKVRVFAQRHSHACEIDLRLLFLPPLTKGVGGIVSLVFCEPVPLENRIVYWQGE
jgi:hypothetical protein